MCAWAPDAKMGQRLLGCARMWRVRVAGRAAMFLGPFAVEQGERNAGFGARLIARACEAAEAAGESHVVLVGDEAYFGRAGFAATPGRLVRMPGPVDQRRVLVRTLRAGSWRPGRPGGPLLKQKAAGLRLFPTLEASKARRAGLRAGGARA